MPAFREGSLPNNRKRRVMMKTQATGKNTSYFIWSAISLAFMFLFVLMQKKRSMRRLRTLSALTKRQLRLSRL